MGKQNEVKYFTKEERERFMTTVEQEGNTRDLIMFKFFLATGMRIGELNGLTVGKLKAGLSYGKLEVTGKGNKTRTIPLVNGINGDLERFLLWKQGNRESIHPNSPVFCNKKGKRLSNRAINYFIKGYCRQAGIRELHAHSFRHSVGFQMGKVGIPIQVIGKLLGHQSIATTRIYCEPDIEQVTEAMARAL